jgi:hypothetical protein
MKKSKGGKTESGTNGDKKNNLTRIWSWNPELAWGFPIGKLLVLD